MNAETAKLYAGDVLPPLAWQWFELGDAVVVDVRSDAERAWVGEVPGAVAIALKQWPSMVLNPDFDVQLQALAQAKPGQKMLFLCRSGVRSVTAALRATQLGIEAYNILEGFEGNADPSGHRGQLGGWRWHGLPWRQS